MSAPISIRLIQEDDLPQILSIYNDIILTTTAVYDYEPHSLAMRRQWYEAKKRDGFPVFVAERDGRVIGFSSFGPFRAWAAYAFSVENSIYVAKDSRGKGIGRMLLAPLIHAATEKSFHVIVAGIDATNLASLQLHRSFGFEEVAHFKQVGFKFGKWLDLKFMELILEGSGRHPGD
jgi:phosphinothricin acetyltransferase